MHEPPKILVVDDDPIFLRSVASVLEAQKYQILTATSGGLALHTAAQETPDLILLDVRMPGMDGIEVLKRLRENSVTATSFVVHLSAQAGPSSVKMEGLQAGADGYISLPVDNVELTSRVWAFLRHKRSMDQLRDSEARYRTLFAGNPEPMWVVAEDSKEFLAVNQAAIHFYGLSEADFLTTKMDKIVRRSDPLPLGPLATVNVRSIQKHRLHDGREVDVEVTQHPLMWNGRSAIASLLNDVTERKLIETERERLLQKYRDEIAEMTPALEKDAQVRNNSFRNRSPIEFDRLSDQYQDALKHALNNRIYQQAHDVSPSLREIAMRMSTQSATPRDVVELHCATLERITPDMREARAQGFVEVGRLAVLELMGNLVSHYRHQLVQKGAHQSLRV